MKYSFELFKEKGYSNTTTREIAQASGIRKGLLHYYYNQKEDIIIEMYDNILDSLNNYIHKEYKGKIDGCTYYAVLNILFYKTMSSKAYLIDLMSEMMLTRSLTSLKIDKSVELCYTIIEKHKIPITKYQMFLATIVAAGSEAELLANMRTKKIKMTYEKLATTINKLLFTMVKISEKQIKTTNEEALKITDNIHIEAVLNYLKSNNSWLESL